MILMLISEEEKGRLSREIKKEPIMIKTSASALNELYSLSFDSIITSRRYSNTVGKENLISAIKALNLILPIGTLDVTYMNHHKVEDEVSKELYKLGCKILKMDILTLDYDTFKDLKYTTHSMKETAISDEEIVNELNEIIEEIEMQESKNIQLYLNVNYDKVSKAFLDTKNLLLGINQIKEDNKELSISLQKSEAIRQSQNEDLLKYRYLYYNLRSNYNKLLSYMTYYKESIDDYNKVLTQSVISNEYIVSENSDTLVIYFKELEDINFFRTFNSISKALENLKLHTKTVVLENNRTYFDPYTPNGYTVVNAFTPVSTAIAQDKLVRYGNASSLLELYLGREQFQIQVLLILDRTENENPLVDTDNQIVYYLGKKRKNYHMEISDENFISPNEGIWTDISILLNAENLQDIPFQIYAMRHRFVNNLIEIVKEEVMDV